MRRRAAIAVLLLLLVACDDTNPAMHERFGDGKVVIMTDEQGVRYAVQHLDGRSYRVSPL